MAECKRDRADSVPLYAEHPAGMAASDGGAGKERSRFPDSSCCGAAESAVVELVLLRLSGCIGGGWNLRADVAGADCSDFPAIEPAFSGDMPTGRGRGAPPDSARISNAPESTGEIKLSFQLFFYSEKDKPRIYFFEKSFT